jgi:tRNA1(Val) A37 N6-methylase TrmN6
MTDPDFTDDQFLQERVKLRQFAKGHRAGSDAVILAATLPPQFDGLVVDAGAASGAVGLMAAWRAPHSRVRLVEIDPDNRILARYNIDSNAMQSRVSVQDGDLLASYAEREACALCQGDADLVLTNPPYLDAGHARISPDTDRVRAHVMPQGGLEKWLLACLQMLKPNGVLTMIHRADQLDDILCLMQGRFGDLAVMPIYPRDDDAATRILISGKRNSRAVLRILPSLVIHRSDGGFTSRAAAIHSGDIGLSMYDRSVRQSGNA